MLTVTETLEDWEDSVNIGRFTHNLKHNIIFFMLSLLWTSVIFPCAKTTSSHPAVIEVLLCRVSDSVPNVTDSLWLVDENHHVDILFISSDCVGNYLFIMAHVCHVDGHHQSSNWIKSSVSCSDPVCLRCRTYKCLSWNYKSDFIGFLGWSSELSLVWSDFWSWLNCCVIIWG